MAHTAETRARAYAKTVERRQEWIRANGPCKVCGSWLDLEVDHVDPSKKIGHKVWSWAEKRRLEELAKCQVLCKSCHRKKTTESQLKPITHGLISSYLRRKCRCAKCCAAQKERMRAYHLAHPRVGTGRQSGEAA